MPDEPPHAAKTQPHRQRAERHAKHHAVYQKLYGDLETRFADIAGL